MCPEKCETCKYFIDEKICDDGSIEYGVCTHPDCLNDNFAEICNEGDDE